MTWPTECTSTKLKMSFHRKYDVQSAPVSNRVRATFSKFLMSDHTIYVIALRQPTLTSSPHLKYIHKLSMYFVFVGVQFKHNTRESKTLTCSYSLLHSEYFAHSQIFEIAEYDTRWHDVPIEILAGFDCGCSPWFW